ncbi:MAG: glycosyl transferase family 1, partial [Actinoallomurus sp.]|nr:glycosyl transferase family 1 [Actinoallomurus sp.]
VFGPAARFASGPAALTAELRAALGGADPRRRAAGRDLASRHTWRAAAERHLAFYRSLRPALSAVVSVSSSDVRAGTDRT